jgi:N-acetylglutamate synthase-like GNAT family acetyltransferase
MKRAETMNGGAPPSNKRQRTDDAATSSSSSSSSSSASSLPSTTAMVAATTPVEDPLKDFSFQVITNDNTEQNSIWLMGAKKIFATQLPKMPREYIVRLVMDRKHKTMVLLKHGTKPVGGICYRPNYTQKFAEIAFCAIDSTEQVKGFGTLLMNKVKEYVKQQNITHFLTYADNYAIGYFEKQGFTKEVTLAQQRWKGYIKDYDGGTLMECVINTKVDYLDIRNVVEQQRQYIYSQIMKHTKVQEIYPGIEVGRKAKAKTVKDLNVMRIEGISESGWGGRSIPRIVSRRCSETQDSSLNAQLLRTFDQIKMHSASWPFHNPVDTDVYEDYSDFVSEPVDLLMVKRRLDKGDYYTSKAKFTRDLLLMCSNCKAFNGETSKYGATATTLESYFTPLLEKITES